MKQPSKIQLQAIKHLSGPALIVAGPGSGKTFTIIQRILYLINHHHISPNEILVITFTKAAALEMKERYETVKDSSINGNVNFGTFHSVCYHILQQSGHFKTDSLIKETDKRKIIQIILSNHGYEEKCNHEVIDNVLSEISRRKNQTKVFDCNSQSTSINRTIFTNEEVELFGREYQSQLAEKGKLDFDDMIGECLKLLNHYPEILEKYRKIFSYILVDEFQDINLPQYEVIKLLAGEKANIFAVGDDDQSIYGFRGTTPGIMQRFLTGYPNCNKIMLTENYRSGDTIVALAEKIISRNSNRIEKKFIPINIGGKILYKCLDTRKEEEMELTDKVKRLPLPILKNSAVILRTNREVCIYKELLRKAGIPLQEVKASGDDIFHSFMLEDITAYLSFLYEGRKRCDFIKFMNKPERYFTRLSLLGEIVNEEMMCAYYARNPAMIKEVKQFFGQLSIAGALSPYMAVSFFRKTMGYDRYIKEKAGNYQEFQRFIRQLDEIQNLLKDFKGKLHAEEFFKEQEEQKGKSDSQRCHTKGISVITMHSAKGLEFSHVFLPDINEGIIPGKNCMEKEDLEEERRLLYVAITRAKEHLYIYCTKERNRKPSSFLQGIILPQ